MSLLKSRIANRKSELEQLHTLLRELRQEAGLRQVDLSDRLGVPQSFVSKYESGERNLNIIDLRHICKALNIPFIVFIQKLEERLATTDET